MPISERPPSPDALPVRKIIRKILAPKDSNLQRWVLSGKATAQLRAVSKASGVPMDVLADSAIAALHACARGSNNKIAVRDRTLREWINRPDAQQGD